MAQPNPVFVLSQPGYATEIIAKGYNAPGCVIDAGTGSNAVTPALSTVSSPLGALAAYAGGQPGTLLIPNPTIPGVDPETGQAQPGLYAVFVDFGPTGGPANLSCVAFLGVGIPPSPTLRWLGGAECSIITQTAGAPTSFIQIAPEAGTGEQLTLVNYSSTAYSGGEVYFTLLSGNTGGFF